MLKLLNLIPAKHSDLKVINNSQKYWQELNYEIGPKIATTTRAL